MKIAMIGAGAMGSLFGAMLTEAGASVTLLDIRKDHVDAINTRGLSVEKDGRERTVRLPATTRVETIGPVDLALVFVKSTQTGAVEQSAARLVGGTGLVLTLQNGMGNADILAGAIDPRRVVAGTTAHGATFLAPGTIRHAGEGETLIGPWNGEGMDHAEAIAGFFRQAGISTRAVPDVHAVLWAKLFVNIGINAITALTGIKNGQLTDLPETRALARDAVREAMAVARFKGIDIQGDPVKNVYRIAAATGPNRSSMGQDVDHRRLTEISAINGFIVRMADDAGIAVPINRALAALIETLQAHY